MLTASIHLNSIIAVTGLAGHAFGSWKSKNMPHMWLRDFLPQSVVNARILTYGYDTKIHGSQSEESILELAKALLESIKTTRRKNIVSIYSCKDSRGYKAHYELEKSADYFHCA